jgi:hypothetical protein
MTQPASFALFANFARNLLSLAKNAEGAKQREMNCHSERSEESQSGERRFFAPLRITQPVSFALFANFARNLSFKF